MGYTIEISINLHKSRHCLDSLKQSIVDKFLQLNCETYYWFHERDDNEFKRGKSHARNNYVGCASFSQEQIDQASQYIGYIRQLKGVYLDCVYQDDIKPKLLYVSPFYMKKMSKDQRRVYKANQREQTLSSQEESLLIHI